MTADELNELDTRYQASKKPTANNLGQQTFDQLVAKKVQEVLHELETSELNELPSFTSRRVRRIPGFFTRMTRK